MVAVAYGKPASVASARSIALAAHADEIQPAAM